MRILVSVAILALIQLGGCVAAAGLGFAAAPALLSHSASRSTMEGVTAEDYVLSITDAEKAIKEVYVARRIDFVETQKDGDDRVVVGKDPSDINVETTIRKLKNGVVRITCQTGTFFGTMGPSNGSEEGGLQIELWQAIKQKLHRHAVGSQSQSS